MRHIITTKIEQLPGFVEGECEQLLRDKKAKLFRFCYYIEGDEIKVTANQIQREFKNGMKIRVIGKRIGVSSKEEEIIKGRARIYAITKHERE